MKEETKMYMNIETGSVAPYDEWFYLDEYGTPVNAVDENKVVEVKLTLHGWEEVQ